jgi:hypothetical protein
MEDFYFRAKADTSAEQFTNKKHHTKTPTSMPTIMGALLFMLLLRFKWAAIILFCVTICL